MKVKKRKIRQVLKKYRQLPLFGFGCIVMKMYLTMLRVKYRFHTWHASAHFYCRPYKKKVAAIIKENISYTGVVEVGCGLGDFGKLLDPSIKYMGIDLDAGAIGAAQFLNSNKNRVFYHGSFEKISLPNAGNCGVLLLVNWPHELSDEELVSALQQHLVDSIKYIVIDSIHKEAQGYSHKHTAESLREAGLQFSLISKIGNIDEVRDLLILKRLA